MGEVAAHADPLRKRFAGSAGWAGVGIAESQPLMDEIADGLHLGPAAPERAEMRPGEIGKKVALAVPAWPKERQHLGRQIRRRQGFRGLVGVILPFVASKDALETQSDDSGISG
jgi:hypothetical protein